MSDAKNQRTIYSEVDTNAFTIRRPIGLSDSQWFTFAENLLTAMHLGAEILSAKAKVVQAIKDRSNINGSGMVN